MNQLPFDVLRIPFTLLAKEDLLQCQTTSRLWHQASVQLLYTKVTLTSAEKFQQYLLTVTNSPRLGLYLKSIDVEYIFSYPVDPKVWKELIYGLLKNCPCIIDFFEAEPNYPTSCNPLKYLQRLPDPTVLDLSLYSYTALQFKKSLTTLTLNTVLDTEGYELITRISEFINLKNLKLIYFDQRGLSYYDSVIDNCVELNTITAHIGTKRNGVIEEKLPDIVRTHNNVYKLDCHLGRLYVDTSLKYIMRKFPELQDITILNSPYVISVESHTTAIKDMISFLEYANTIKKFNVTLKLSNDDLFEFWKIWGRKINQEIKMHIFFQYSVRQGPDSTSIITFKNDVILIKAFFSLSTVYVIFREDVIHNIGYGVE